MSDIICKECGEIIWSQTWQRFNLQRIVDAEEDPGSEKCPLCLKSDFIDLSEKEKVQTE